MSKVVKGVGRAVGKVVNGVSKVVTKVTGSKTLGKIAKVLAVAATVYFGGAAISGAFGGGAAALGGSSGLAGAATNISAAWSSLGSAVTSAVGGNFAAAGSNLAAGFGGNTLAGAEALGSIASSAAPAASQWVTQPGGLNVLASEAAPAAAKSGSGLISSAWNGLGQYGKAAVVQGGLQMGGAYLQGAGQQKQKDDERNRYNQNVAGYRLNFGPTYG